MRDASVVDEYVDRPERVERCFHDRSGAFGISDAVDVGHGFAACLPYLLYDSFRVRPQNTSPVGTCAEVVDDDLGSS
jgi:hypothetical protein